MESSRTTSSTPVQPIVCSRSEWYGDKQDGIEVRMCGDHIDEIVVYRNGQCCVHIEQMSDQCYWMSLMSERFEVHANIYGKNGRSHVDANAEGWPRTERTNARHHRAAPGESGIAK